MRYCNFGSATHTKISDVKLNNRNHNIDMSITLAKQRTDLPDMLSLSSLMYAQKIFKGSWIKPSGQIPS
jgi:hypothetical protein